MFELKIFDTITKKECQKVMQAIEAYGGKMVDPDDYEQLNSYLDQMYIDYKIDNNVITLHYEHYLGIFLLSETLDVSHLQEIWNKVKALLPSD